MKLSDDKIKNIFSSKLTNYQKDVPDLIWDKLDKDLSDNFILKKNRKNLYRSIIITGAIAASLILGMIFIETNDNIGSPLPVEFQISGFSYKDDNISENIEQEYIYKSTAVNNLIVRNNNLFSKNEVPDNNQPDLKADIEEKVEEGFDEDIYQPARENRNEKERSSKKEDMAEKINEFEKLGKDSRGLLSEADILTKKTKSDNGFSISIGGKSGMKTKENFDADFNQSAYKVMVAENDAYAESSGYTPFSKYKEDPVEMKHNQPISFGVTVSKKISNKLSVETGLIYTYLSSKIKSKKSSALIRDDSQYFHYLGVPVFLNYHFAQWGKADFYISFGGMLQKDIYGKLKGEQILEEMDNSVKFNEKISQDNLQFSLMSTIGVSYPIYNKLNVYTSIGGAYYVDAKNEYKTVYSDKKIQLDLNAGLKFEF